MNTHLWISIIRIRSQPKGAERRPTGRRYAFPMGNGIAGNCRFVNPKRANLIKTTNQLREESLLYSKYLK